MVTVVSVVTMDSFFTVLWFPWRARLPLMVTMVTSVRVVRMVTGVPVVTIVGMATVLWFSWLAWLPRL